MVSLDAIVAHLPADAAPAVVADGRGAVVAVAPGEVRTADGAAAFPVLAELGARGFWIGFLAYELGRAVERVTPGAADDLPVPDLCFARYDARLLWHPDRPPEVLGSGEGRHLLQRAVWRAQRSAPPPRRPAPGPWRSEMSRAEHADRVRAVQELLQAGECYQVNLTRRLRAEGRVDPVALWRILHAAQAAPHGALCTFGTGGPDLAVVSASPELFLRRRGRRIETRPIKGTGADAAALAASAKDRAENVMIVDLARNDLGRVCRYGTVAVDDLCRIEAHPGLVHLVSTVTGELRPGTGLDALVRATFPPASVTGAPKPRVLQAIEDLEPVRRGAYCGAVGWVHGDDAQLAVAIRTFTVHPGTVTFGVGGGIVADSRPDDEWAETELKSARLLAAAGAAAVGSATRGRS